ncbi:MAG: hypothetical protein Q7T71_10265 [Herbiconiux sp.]|nr:hypothetical protein [Herbiconiux sp.]
MSASALLASYCQIFAVPGSAAFVVAGWFGRLPRSTLSLAAVLLIAAETGSYTLAAVVAAALVVGTALIAPLWSRAMDRAGQRRVLLAGAVASAISAVLLVAAVTAHLPTWTWFAAAFLVGASSVDVGSATRARWSALVPEGHPRHTAYSLESVVDESVFVIGPPVITVLAALVNPLLGIAVGLLLGLGGQLALVLQRSTAPAVHPDARAAGLPLVRPIPRGVVGVLPLFLGVGVVFGSVDLTSVGFAEAEGVPAAAGYLLAMLAIGSVLAGLVFGILKLAVAPPVRVGVTALLYGLVVPAVALMPGVVTAGLALLAAGLVTTPLLISGMALVETSVDRARLTEALAWPGAAMSIGFTAGSSLAGVAIDAGAASNGFTVTAAGAAVVGVGGLITLASHRLRSQRATSLLQGD